MTVNKNMTSTPVRGKALKNMCRSKNAGRSHPVSVGFVGRITTI